jgi:predicted 3-demethylubiquinone-9 3-methyltransferase (glyoxalase superfamily)
MSDQRHKLIPFLTFHGNAEEAIIFYSQAFPDTKIEELVRYEEGMPGEVGTVLHGTMSIMDQQFMFMDFDSAHDLPPITWATSFYIKCTDEAQFDSIFDALKGGGSVMMGPEPVMHMRKVAWVTDKFGVTWQPVWE